jgi:hypothetical protein
MMLLRTSCIAQLTPYELKNQPEIPDKRPVAHALFSCLVGTMETGGWLL